MHDVDDADSLNRLMPLVYDELRTIAYRQLAKERLVGGHASLETTALVHEVYLKLAGGPPRTDGGNQAHFLALVTLNDEIMGAEAPERLLEIDAAIRDLAALERDWTKARAVLRRVLEP